MTQLDFTWERREELIRMEERAEGHAEGHAEGYKQAHIDAIKKMISKGYSKEQILELDYSEEEYQQAIQENSSTEE